MQKIFHALSFVCSGDGVCDLLRAVSCDARSHVRAVPHRGGLQHQRGLVDRGHGPDQLPLHPRQQPLQPEVLLRALALVDLPDAGHPGRGPLQVVQDCHAWAQQISPLKVNKTY